MAASRAPRASADPWGRRGEEMGKREPCLFWHLYFQKELGSIPLLWLELAFSVTMDQPH